jgi:hypothetical protein
MSADRVLQTLEEYLRVLLARGDYGRFFADDIALEWVGTGQSASGPEAAEQTIRFLHETAFDGGPELVNLVVDDRGGAAEVWFVGTHTGEFAGVRPTGNSIRVPYSVFYDVEADKITGLRIYMAMDQILGQLGGGSQA